MPRAGLEPVSDLDEVAATLAFLAVHVSQVASNRVFQNGEQKIQLEFDNMIKPDQNGVMSRKDKYRVNCFFEL